MNISPPPFKNVSTSIQLRIHPAYSIPPYLTFQSRANGNWPPPEEEMPAYDAELFLAVANVPKWDSYAEVQLDRLNALAVEEGRPKGKRMILGCLIYAFGCRVIGTQIKHKRYFLLETWQNITLTQLTGKIRCILIIRDPFSRFKSLFQYAHDGGEYGLKEEMKVLHEMTK